MKSFGQKSWMLPQPVLIIGTYDKNASPMLWTDGAARAETKLVWIMPSRDRGRRSQLHIYRNGKKILILAGKAQPKVIREDKLNELITILITH